MAHSLENSTILVTGGTGSWGQELIRHVLNEFLPREIRVFSRGARAQLEMQIAFGDPRLSFVLGDVRDKNALQCAMRDVEFVFHLAALKYIPMCEVQSWEAVLTNIYGTRNVIEAALECGVSVVIGASTDKAVDAFSFYGITKACAEKLLIGANTTQRSGTRFVCVRVGNVLGSTGSVLHVFMEQIQRSNRIALTDPEMTRFIATSEQATALLCHAATICQGGEVFVPRMRVTTVRQLGLAVLSLFGGPDTGMVVIGPRQGEKKHEVIISSTEIAFTRELVSGDMVIVPQFADHGYLARYEENPAVRSLSFSSEVGEQLSPAAIEGLIREHFARGAH